MLRLFVAVEIPDEIKDQLCELQNGLFGARWVPYDNFHITLRFLGDMHEHDAEDLHHELVRLRYPAFDLRLCEIGYFKGHRKEPRTLWTGVNNFHVLDGLFDKVETAAKRAGAKDSKNKFHAHSTLARLKNTPVDEVHNYISRNNLFKSDRFHVSHFTLFSSTLTQDGAKYKILDQYPLVEAGFENYT